MDSGCLRVTLTRDMSQETKSKQFATRAILWTVQRAGIARMMEIGPALICSSQFAFRSEKQQVSVKFK